MVYEDELIRERLHKLLHRENLTQQQFAVKIGRKQSNVSEILGGKRHIPRGFYSDLFKAFPDLNKDWMLLGEGFMFVGKEEEVYNHPTDTRPRLPRTLVEGHLEDYYNGAKRFLCQEKPIITQFPDYDFSLFLKTDRMSPNYRRGDELFFKKTDIKEWGSCMLLDTAEGPKFKKIYEDVDEKGNNVIRCASYNKVEFPDFNIPRNLVHGFYKCVGVLRIL